MHDTDNPNIPLREPSLMGALAGAINATNLAVGRPPLALGFSPLAGYLVGWFSSLPPMFFLCDGFLKTLLWPVFCYYPEFTTDPFPSYLQPAIGPLKTFGMVTLILTAALLWSPRSLSRSLPFLLGASLVSAIGGSVWFFIGAPKYVLLLSALWGLLVGIGLWRAQRRSCRKNEMRNAI